MKLCKLFFCTIILIFYIISLANAIDPRARVRANAKYGDSVKISSIDPWENIKIETKNTEDSVVENKPNIKTDEPYIGDAFYKRLLRIIIYRARFVEQKWGMMEGTLHIQFPKKEYEMLMKYLDKKTDFTPSDFRELDGLMSEHIYELSSAQKFAEKWIEIMVHLYNHYSVHLLILIGVVICLFPLYHLKWSMIPMKSGALLVVFLAAVAWEIRLAIMEASLKDYEEFSQSLKCPWYYFWKTNCKTEVKHHVSHFWHLLHPMKILGNLFNKLVTSNIDILFISASQASGKLWWPLNDIVYILLCVVIFMTILTLFYAVICVLFNKPFKLSLLKGFLNVHFNGSQHNPTSQSRIYSNENLHLTNKDSISGENLEKLINIFSNVTASGSGTLKSLKNKVNTEEKTENHTKKSKSSQEPEMEFSRILLNSSKKCTNENNIKQQPIKRVSSLPDIIMAGGDHL